MIKIQKFGIIFMLSVLLAGCGYTTRSMISDKYHTIYIPAFANKINITNEGDTASKYKIFRPYIDSDITKEVINRYLFDGNLKPLKSENTADLILKGEVTEFRKDPIKYDQNDEVEEYRVNMVVNLTLWDRKEDKLVWEEKGFTGDYTYFTSGTLSKPESTAINESITDLARRIVERTVEEW